MKCAVKTNLVLIHELHEKKLIAEVLGHFSCCIHTSQVHNGRLLGENTSYCMHISVS